MTRCKQAEEFVRHRLDEFSDVLGEGETDAGRIFIAGVEAGMLLMAVSECIRRYGASKEDLRLARKRKAK